MTSWSNKKIIPEGPKPHNSTPLTNKKAESKSLVLQKLKKTYFLDLIKKNHYYHLYIKYKIIKIIGSINKLSINKPISVSTLIFFLVNYKYSKNKATIKPTQGNEVTN